ncbi:tyrosine-type recombinase/integrase [Dyadobacter diqingensis]|uniref:tyrosine-type recombinase/integrase n=1 Tax=Dyadobacter diqingensis TaxID=2938121 RepID=UPI0020C1A3DC|nr:site-specific integrase [Dyadobacter diqingensis]
MSLSKATAKIVLDKRRIKQDGKYPLKLRVTYLREYKDYIIAIDLSMEDYERITTSKKLPDLLRDVKIRIQFEESKANQIIRALPEFGFKIFESHYFGNTPKAHSGDIYALMEKYIAFLTDSGRISTAQSYQSALNSLKAFQKRLRFDDITVDFLKKYEREAKNKGTKDTTVGIYLRSFRTIVNQAIESGYMRREDYPFKKGKYVIPASQNIKKALTQNQIDSIIEFKRVGGSNEDMAIDIWLFSYFCNGLNIKDICRLRYSNIENKTMRVVRAKTELTSRNNQKQITIPLHDFAKLTIDKWGNKNTAPENHIFPFLPLNASPLRERMSVQNVTKLVNKYMKKVGKTLDIKIPLTTYVARHSFSTIMMQNDAPLVLISRSLGHNSIKTTENYLGSHENDVMTKYSDLLTKVNVSEKFKLPTE